MHAKGMITSHLMLDSTLLLLLVLSGGHQCHALPVLEDVGAMIGEVGKNVDFLAGLLGGWMIGIPVRANRDLQNDSNDTMLNQTLRNREMIEQMGKFVSNVGDGIGDFLTDLGESIAGTERQKIQAAEDTQSKSAYAMKLTTTTEAITTTTTTTTSTAAIIDKDVIKVSPKQDAINVKERNEICYYFVC